jgi:predicted nuclease with TOPRIM domain
MNENVENLVLEHLRAIRATLANHSQQFEMVQLRLGSLEYQMSGLRNDFVRLEVRFDRLEQRVERIERRLELTDLQA